MNNINNINDFDVIWEKIKIDKEISFRDKKQIATEISNLKSLNKSNSNNETSIHALNELIDNFKKKVDPWYYRLRFW
ncbi:MAG: hypothetical protein AM1032_000037 [Mycoplasmataceae bacterium]|nr:MAG: hypothetical protein AM1032_000037 [Mycoplasmataceae bacterium]